jgi:hypothetical protein
MLQEGESPLLAPMEYGDRTAVSLEGFAIDDQRLVPSERTHRSWSKRIFQEEQVQRCGMSIRQYLERLNL